MIRFLKKFVCTAVAAAVAASLLAVNAAAAPTLVKSVDIPIGSSETITVNGAASVTWTDCNVDIVSHKASKNSATLTGVSTGATYMIADVNGTKLKCKVTVKQSFITPSAEKVELNKGKSKTVTIKVKGSKSIAVKSSDKSVCTASLGKWSGDTATLTVTAKKNGTATVRVYAKKFENSTAKDIFVNVGGQAVDEGPTEEEQLAAEVVKLVNKERKAAGLGKLKSDDTLNAAAAMRAKELAELYSHTRPDGTSGGTAVNDVGAPFSVKSENIAWTTKASAEKVMESWMNSPPHKAAILKKDFGKIGVACFKSGDRYYWVQVFTD